MIRKTQKKDSPQVRERLAQLGLAADPAEAGGACLDDSQFGALLEAAPGSAEQARFFEHLSRCESCFQKWMVLTDVLGTPAKTRSRRGSRLARRGLVGAVGSACGLALGVMLYLSIDHQPLDDDAADLASVPASVQSARSPEPQATDGSAESGLMEQRPDAALSVEARRVENSRAKAELPVLAEQKTAGGSAAPEGSQAVGSIVQSDDERSADAAAEVSPPLRMNRERAVFSSRGPATGSLSFVSFAASLADLCTAHPETAAPEDMWRPILDTGRLLLGSKLRWEGESREFVEKSVRLLEKETAIDDKEWGELCEHARRLVPQQGGAVPGSR